MGQAVFRVFWRTRSEHAQPDAALPCYCSNASAPVMESACSATCSQDVGAAEHLLRGKQLQPAKNPGTKAHPESLVVPEHGENRDDEGTGKEEKAAQEPGHFARQAWQ